MAYLVVDALRLSDLKRQDTTAQTLAEAKREAEAMAQKHGCKVVILAVVGEVEGQVTPRWTQDPEPASQAQVAPTFAGWYGISP